MDTQLKKGVLELCVLSCVNFKDCYGFELVTEISRNIQISDGTIYPILRRLTKEGYFETYLKESTEGPPRKYYSLTKEGKERLLDLKKEWEEFVISVGNIINADTENICKIENT